jgi:hypothetical protein
MGHWQRSAGKEAVSGFWPLTFQEQSMQSSKASYAGIGSRETPQSILARMEQLGRRLAKQGLVLSTGNCRGADQAFAHGVNAVAPHLVELYLPWPGYEAQAIVSGNKVYATPSRQAYAIASKHHPAWQQCSQAAQALHARNVQIVLGAKLSQPVEFVLCWTPRGKAVGGTAMGIRIAEAYSIEVRNLAAEEEESERLAYSQAEFGW